MRAPILAFLALLTGSPVPGTTRVNEMSGCIASDHPICVALRADEPKEREAAVRQAVRETLLSSELESRDKAWGILTEIFWKTDLYPYLDLLDAFKPLAQKNQNVADLADLVEVNFAPRSRRIELLAPLILSGSGRLPRGTILLRTSAIEVAARQGLVEFLPAVTAYLAVLEPERIRARRLISVPALFELCGGAASRSDATVVALRRLLAIEERTLENRFPADEGFREAVFSLEYARCPLGVEKEPESCALLRQIVARQLEYRGTPPSPAAIPGESTDWVVRLQEILSRY